MRLRPILLLLLLFVSAPLTFALRIHAPVTVQSIPLESAS